MKESNAAHEEMMKLKNTLDNWKPKGDNKMKDKIVKVEKIEELAIRLPEDFAEVGEKVNVAVRDDGSMVISKLVDIEIDLPNDVLLSLAMMAHEQDITLNELCCNIWRKIVETDGKCLDLSDEPIDLIDPCPCGTQRCYPEHCDAYQKYKKKKNEMSEMQK